ncbi:MAG: Uma2 family endonuclease, partial [Waterburya sp.]
DKSSGKEPDESYCFNILKDTPDLAIEVIESSGSLDDLEKYLRLSVKEVWFWRMETLPFRELVPHSRWQKNRLKVYVNQGDRYTQPTTSYCLPNLNLELLASLIKQIDTGNLRLLKKQFISQLTETV